MKILFSFFFFKFVEFDILLQTIGGIGNRVTVMHWASAPCFANWIVVTCCHLIAWESSARFCPHHFFYIIVSVFCCCCCCCYSSSFSILCRAIATGHQLNGLSIYGKRVNDSRCSLQSNIKIQDKYYEMCDWIMRSIERNIQTKNPDDVQLNDHINFKLILHSVSSLLKKMKRKTILYLLQLKKKWKQIRAKVIVLRRAKKKVLWAGKKRVNTRFGIKIE